MSPQVHTALNSTQLNATGVQMVRAPTNRIVAQIQTKTARACVMRTKLPMEKILVYGARMET
ncbi:hypothetical protein PG996_009887 [Apiospora saccharicola]|uniref:Uncharacterized protein n=1 Tax=Apiospora saccharicola TaxID=335842 RepID=A0ABR1UM20_9PEZI